MFDELSFDYFPSDYLSSVLTGELKDKHTQYVNRLYSEDLYDTTKVDVGMVVRTNDFKLGVVTDFHLTERGIESGYIEVKLEDETLDYYYANQLNLIVI